MKLEGGLLALLKTNMMLIMYAFSCVKSYNFGSFLHTHDTHTRIVRMIVCGGLLVYYLK